MAEKMTDKELKICATRWLEKNAAVVGRYGNEPVYAEFILEHLAALGAELAEKDALWKETAADALVTFEALDKAEARVAELEAEKAEQLRCAWYWVEGNPEHSEPDPEGLIEDYGVIEVEGGVPIPTQWAAYARIKDDPYGGNIEIFPTEKAAKEWFEANNNQPKEDGNG